MKEEQEGIGEAGGICRNRGEAKKKGERIE